jgi:HAD superfamily hydrolase (TIGR01450 family)
VDGSGAAKRKDRRPLAQRYDAALVDLDGVVYVGADPVPRAADVLRAAAGHGMRICYVTNNASRTPQAVAEQLRRFGHDASAGDIATSAQAVAAVLRDRLPSGARVLVVGGEGLRTAVADSGFALVAGSEQQPAAVAQGYSVDTTYDDLAQASLAIHSGALWVASNADPTMPSPRGLLPGNGALFAAVRTATATEPLIAGKPELALHREAIARTAARTPLVVGDRLDTDILGASRAGVDSLLVLTGVTTPNELRSAPQDCRPTYVAADLGGLLHPLRPVRAYGERWSDAVLAALARERGEAAADRPDPLRP